MSIMQIRIMKMAAYAEAPTKFITVLTLLLSISACLVLHGLQFTKITTQHSVRINMDLAYGIVFKTEITGEIGRTHGRGKKYLATKIPYSTKGISCYHIRRIALSGDVQINPGPAVKRLPKYPCKDCKKNVRNNQDALLCVACKVWSHAKCLGMSKEIFKYYLNNPELDWVCSTCSLPFNAISDADFAEELLFGVYSLLSRQETYIEADNANQESLNSSGNSIIEERQTNPSEALIIHLNINSLQNKFDELKILNETLKAHVLVISETKIDSSYPNKQFALDGYNMYRKDRAKGGGGLIAYFASSIPSRKLTLAKPYKTLEAIAVDAKIGRRDLIFLAVYRPPKKSGKIIDKRHKYLELVEQEINDIVMWASLQKQSVILMGDLNMDRLRPNEREGKILIDMEEVNNMQCMISEPTRITPNSQTLLDVIMTTSPELFRKCGTYEPGMSDHCLVYGVMTEKICKHKSKIITFRNVKNIDQKQLNQDLLVAPWHVADIFNGIDDKNDYWNGLLESIINEHAPIKSKRVRERDVPYMTMEWKKAIRNKRKYAVEFAKNRTQENFELKRKYRNIASRERRKAISAYWRKKSEELYDKPSEFYSTFKPFFKDKVEFSPEICLRNNDGTVTTNQLEVANIFANYFTTAADSIGGDHVNNLLESDHNNHKSVKKIREMSNGLCFEFNKFSQEEVNMVLEKLNPRKSCGWNPRAPPKLLKMIAIGIAPSLTRLYNECIDMGEWPSHWKMGEWTPAFKNGDKQVDKNYRPITSLLTIDKMFEQLLCKQVSGKFDSTLHDRMSAYRKNHSCETTLLRLTEDWKRAIDERELVCILSTDMSKAFDSLSHSLILKKLEAYGFVPDSLNLMRSFFEKRMNRVKLGNNVSEWMNMIRGCPQGSSFGPLLWNLFQNDMAHYVRNADLTMYADDHQLYTMGKDFDKVRNNLEKEGKLAASWYKDNYLLANPDKFQSMIINPRNLNTNSESPNIHIDGRIIKNTEYIKLLGVYFDENINFSKHISEMCKKVSKKVGVLMRLRNLIPCSAKLTIYKVYILSSLTYCHLVWHYCKSSDNRKIERIQERALRAVYRTKSESYETLMNRAGLPTLYNRRLQDIATFMYKIKNKLLPSSVADIFNIKESCYSLRNSDFHIPRVNTTKYGKHSLRYFGPSLWYKLSDDIRKSPSINSFKTAIRKVDINGLLDNNCNCCDLCRE